MPSAHTTPPSQKDEPLTHRPHHTKQRSQKPEVEKTNHPPSPKGVCTYACTNALHLYRHTCRSPRHQPPARSSRLEVRPPFRTKQRSPKPKSKTRTPQGDQFLMRPTPFPTKQPSPKAEVQNTNPPGGPIFNAGSIAQAQK